ncbi:MAG TPA: ABC transporter permease [Candidatus Acidoferrales bacterium]|nr:ABC transporter permease [Candidatus Acidoferrales bacterium]
MIARVRSFDIRSVLMGSIGFVVLFVCWYLLTTVSQVISPIRFPAPSNVYQSFAQLMSTGYADATLGTHIAYSLRIVVLGYVASVLTGIPLGIVMGLSRRAEGIINPVFQLLRPIPPLAWIPLSILWFGLGPTSEVFVIWLAAFAPLVINTYAGVRLVDPTLIAAARVHGAKTTRLIADVIVPGALPMIFTGLRLSVQVCWMALVAAELVGSTAGLGHIMIYAERDLNSGMIAAGMISVTVLGVMLTFGVSMLEKAMMPWRRP